MRLCAQAICLEEMLGLALEGRRPAALVVRKGSFADWRGAKPVSPYALEREAARLLEALKTEFGAP